MISYDIPLYSSVMGVIWHAGSMNLIGKSSKFQGQKGVWFIVPQIVGFLVFLIASIAELNRSPFDLPEAESELVAGIILIQRFRFAFFMFDEYVYMFAMSSLMLCSFLAVVALPCSGFRDLRFSKLHSRHRLVFLEFCAHRLLLALGAGDVAPIQYRPADDFGRSLVARQHRRHLPFRPVEKVPWINQFY